MGRMRNITIVDYSPDWPAAFAAEAGRIAEALGPVLVEIHHVGSTSVPGLAAKPLIDMLPVVRSLEELDSCSAAMIALGYEPKGEFGIAGRRFFTKGDDAHRTHHVHAFAAGHPAIEEHLVFRDYLRAHPDQARRYAKLKKQLAQQHRNDIEAYYGRQEPADQGAARSRPGLEATVRGDRIDGSPHSHLLEEISHGYRHGNRSRPEDSSYRVLHQREMGSRPLGKDV